MSSVQLLFRKAAVAFAVAFLGVFLPATLNVLDKVAHGTPSGLGKSLIISVVAAAVAAGLRAALALSPINIFPSDARNSLFPRGGAAIPRAAHLIAVPTAPAVRVTPLTETAVKGKRLGRHVDHDERSRRYAIAESAGPPVTAVLWHRHGRPFNQGNLGSCTGNAIAGILNTDPFRAARKGRLLTEKDAVALYELATQLDSVSGVYPPDDTGSSGLAACKAAVKLGYISGYRHAFSLRAALAALQHGPVITGVNWYEGFDTPDANGVVEISGQVRGGHEFEVIGYDPATDLVTAENSWGSSFGKAGRFFFTSATWGQLLAQQGDVTVPVPVGSAS